MRITFPDKTVREFPPGTTAAVVAGSLGNDLRHRALAAVVNGVVTDLNTPIHEDATVSILTFDDPLGREVFWHSSAHVMAAAILRLFPETKLAIGPAIPDDFAARFYYDIDLPRKLTDEDLRAIEQEMARIVAADQPFRHFTMPREEALKQFEREGNPYKFEIVAELPEESVSFYAHGDFVDMCRGPHLPSTGLIGAFRLLSVAGAYWRGDEKNKMLQRVYGVSFPDTQMLEEHLANVEKAKERDHRYLGRLLDLFSISDEIGAGLVLWHPKGALIRHLIETFWKEEHLRNGYDIVYTPHIARLELWQRSGHLDFYRSNMYEPIEVENQPYQLKPMNCPFHIAIYNSRKRSYRELPLRWAELGTVYRYERSGVLHGLPRVRGFTQDDAHVFCRPEQLEDELCRLLEFNLFFLRTFGFNEYDTFLSTRPEQFVGTDEAWEKATAALKSALEKMGLPYQIDPGEGVFYGPKIDVKIKDVLGRSWQCTTIQVDFNLPEKFDVTYVGEDGHEHRAVMIHRALLGSIERFFGVLVEHYGGDFPLWLAPVQARVMSVVEAANDYANKVTEQLLAAGIRAESDTRSHKINYKIREAENQKIPYMLIVGPKESRENKVSVRRRHRGDLGQYAIADLVTEIQNKVTSRSLE